MIKIKKLFYIPAFIFIQSIFQPVFAQDNPSTSNTTGGIGLSPIRLDISSSQKPLPITVTNSGSEAVTMQASVVNWTQNNGEDVFSDSSDLLITPPLFRLAPSNSKQIVRVGFENTSPTDQLINTEKAWRVFLEQLPDNSTSQTPTGGSQIKIRLRISIPVFLAPSHPVYNLTWKVGTPAIVDGQLNLIANNSGNIHQKIVTLTIKDENGNLLGQLNGPIYVLPGNSKSIKVSLKNSSGNSLHLSSDTEHEANSQTSLSIK